MPRLVTGKENIFIASFVSVWLSLSHFLVMKNNVWVEPAPALVKEDRGSGSATINNID